MAIPVHWSMVFNIVSMAPKSLLAQSFCCASTSSKILCTTDLLSDAELGIPNPWFRFKVKDHLQYHYPGYKRTISFEHQQQQQNSNFGNFATKHWFNQQTSHDEGTKLLNLKWQFSTYRLGLALNALCWFYNLDEQSNLATRLQIPCVKTCQSIITNSHTSELTCLWKMAMGQKS